MIRLAVPEDAAAIQAIYAPYVRHTPISFELEPPTIAEMVRRITTTLPMWPWLVDERDGTVCGYAYAGQHRTRAAYRWSADVAVYVADGHQRQGIGHGLYRVLLELLKAQGYRAAFGGITQPNEGSVALHESMGFKPVGIYAKVGYKAGAWHDVGWWGLDLGGPDGEPREPIGLDAINLPEAWV